MAASIIGFPRIGEHRELKFITEKYFRREVSAEELQVEAKALRKKHWLAVKNSGIDYIPSNDFSLYDNVLDTAVLFNIIPKKVADLGLSALDTYFALARGYQGEKGDIHALPMKKWFNTNYHYLVPYIEASTNIKLEGTKIFDEYKEAKDLGIETTPVIVGPFTLLSLAEYEESVTPESVVPSIVAAYTAVFEKLSALGARVIQLDEPSLVTDIDEVGKKLLHAIYDELLTHKNGLRIYVQTYFGDVRDVYSDLIALNIDGLGLDFVEGRKTLELVQSGFPEDKVLIAGVVNGKNIWRNHYKKTVELLQSLPAKQVVISTSCSLLHVPYTTAHESFDGEVLQHFAFAIEKLQELKELDAIVKGEGDDFLEANNKLFSKTRVTPLDSVKKRIAALTETDYTRLPALNERAKLQEAEFKLPELPTTTIGSFPQTKEVKQNRAAFKRGEKDLAAYEDFIKAEIDRWIAWQEEVDLDVLVHGEFERNDMVEYFGENLSGYLFSKNGWVQSYGTRGVKPPIIWGDVEREAPITVEWSKYAQSKTERIVKGMLTGPVTILNWSFPREDISLKESTLQIALAIRDEVLDLEAAGIKIIQIDEAALREKLPLRKSDWVSEYLEWAIPAFRLVHSGVKGTTQIHTHMCYSQFTDIVRAIDDMDADVISFEASRSNLEILDELKAQNFQTQVGPGVYDIHSPRIPSVEEISKTIAAILGKVQSTKVWINPDCGLKTRGEVETKASLVNLVKAAKLARKNS